MNARPRVLRADGRVDDVAIAVGRAGTHLLRIGLRVAHRHAEPERRGKLEVNALLGERHSARTRCWGAGELQEPPITVARASSIGVEEIRWLVMSNVASSAKSLGVL